ncbi:peptide chain release factor N(5)-glutamine methyltransferase [Algoriphagus zhangzhouensis]|uniref:Release factor glutamine methyltransferase n=1 Tax=Algoriphagus zhangzhouensis TaxID=1073327 RepID=A0A1M7ZA22_9BACT|nr:peptide chain release factor N(5)-glutamine methyltransferase [Algoriphagus zhangzhouensis]TDY47277.1 release factor glutamine methyltransferase [Algoriphagus zhangzhouensis]SHO61724.1 release factor glutamine methyltransferase [Algoriphagus zhangzhouensis]
MINYNSLVINWASELEIYNFQEAQNLVSWLFEHHLGLKPMERINLIDEQDLPKQLFADFEKLKTGEPIQYVLGKGPFYGREFFVTQDTLIPRNETEELVHLIIKENPQPNLKILDIGTGTGCIPISLFLEMNQAKVFGIDVSEKALEVAKKNGGTQNAQVNWILCDILQKPIPENELDILVSNPPYIPEQGKALMHNNVLDFEPGLALFVPDSDPLLFYREIAQKGLVALKKGGKIYFEIHEEYGKRVVELLESLGYSQVQCLQDLNGKDRIVKGNLN